MAGGESSLYPSSDFSIPSARSTTTDRSAASDAVLSRKSLLILGTLANTTIGLKVSVGQFEANLLALWVRPLLVG
jgi:hypothetical protein